MATSTSAPDVANATGKEAPQSYISYLARFRATRVGATFTPKNVVLVLVAAVVSYLALTPLLFLFRRMATDELGNWTTSNLVQAYRDPIAPELMWNSAVFAFGSTILAMVIGTGLAYLHARTDISFKPALFAASIVPLIMPGLLYTVSWVVLASPNTGLFNMVFDNTLGVRPFNIFSMPGMIWVEATSLSPLVFLLMLAAFRSMDPSLEESALVSGASNWRVVRRITFPLVKPAFLAAALIMAVRAIESFEVPALLGIPGGTWVFTSRIWSEMTRFPSNIGRASAYASVLLALAVIGVVLHNWFAKRGGEKAVQTIGGKAFQVRPRALTGGARVVANTLVLLFVAVVIVLPAASLLYASLLPTSMVPSGEAFRAMSLANYTFVFDSDVVKRGAINSAFLAIASATTVMFLMAVVAWIVVRTKLRGRVVLDTLSFIPMTFPGIVLGLALLFVYLRVPLPIYGTLGILFVAYLTKYMPYGMRYAATSMYQIHNELEESAQVAGASWWQTFRRVILPLLVPGLMAGWIYIAIISVRELSSSLLIYSPGNEVLAVSMWNLYNEARTNELAALGVMLMAGLTVLVGIAYKLGSRVGIRQDERTAA